MPKAQPYAGLDFNPTGAPDVSLDATDPSSPFFEGVRVSAPVPPAPTAVVSPIFDPSTATPVPSEFDPSTATLASDGFDPNNAPQRIYTFEEFAAKPKEELIADKDFMPVQFGLQNKAAILADPALQSKVEEVYKARETAGTSAMDKVKAAFKGAAPAAKLIAQGVGAAAKLSEKLSLPGLAKRVIAAAVSPEVSTQDVINSYAKSGTEAAASVELAALGSTDLLRRSNRAVGEAVGVEPSDLVTVPAMALRAAQGPAKSKADLTEGDWRNRYFDDVEAAENVERAGQGNGVVMKGFGIDAATLERDHNITVDPDTIAKLSVVTDPINYVPLGAAVGAVTKIGGKAVRLGVAATQSTKQAAKLAEVLNAATAAASGLKSGAADLAGSAAKAVGGAAEKTGLAVGKVIGPVGLLGGTGIGALLGGDVYSALKISAALQVIPQALLRGGRALKAGGKVLTGETKLPAALTLAGDTLAAGAKGAVKGAAEGGILILPFEIGARPEEEEQLLGMIGLGAGIRAGVEGVRPGARSAGRAAQNKLAETIFKTVEQSDLAESPTYGTDPLLDSNHTANVAKISPREQKLVAWGRELLREAGGEVYVLDTPAFAREAQGNKTARGYAISIGESVSPEGTAKPLFRIFLNKDAEALPHEFFHALTDLDPKRAADFRDTVKKSLTPEQLKSFGQLYSTLLNNGLPEVQWKSRLSPEQVVNEVAAEAFSRVFLAQDLSGVAPSVQQKAALFVSSLLEKVGAPLAGVGKKGAPGASSLGVRAGTESVKLGSSWVKNMVERVNEQGTLGEPPIIAQRPDAQTPIPADVVSRKAAGAKPVPAAPVPVPPPTVPPVNPPLPAVPAPGARNIRTKRAAQDDFAGQRAEVTNVDPARRAAEATGDANTIARVSEISDLIESGSPVVEIEHSGVRAAGTETAPFGRTARRAEQEAAYIAEGMANAPVPIREAYQKVFVPVRWEVVGGKPQLLAMSLDKVIANAHKAVKESAARGVAERIPYEIVDGKLTDAAWGQFVEDLKAYADNQANGYRGDGQKLVRPTEDVGLSIPAENPAYNPRPITEERANFINLTQGLNPPLTARVGKQSSAVLPGNVKGQILAEVNRRQPEVPSVIRPEDITKQEFKGTGRSVAETNPLRNELAAAGVPVRELIEVTERINAADINAVKPRPELDFKAPVTDTIRGGFLPDGQVEINGTIARYEPTGDKSNPYRVIRGDRTYLLHREKDGRLIGLNEKTGAASTFGFLSDEGGILKQNPPRDLGERGGFLPGDTAKQIADVQAMSADEFAAATKSWDGGLTKQAWKIGLEAASPEDVAALKAANVDAGLKARAAIKEKDFTTAGTQASRAQFFREAFEAATDTGSAAGDIGWRVAFPDRQAPFPEAKAGAFMPGAETDKALRNGQIPDPNPSRPEGNEDVRVIAAKISTAAPHQGYDEVNVPTAKKLAEFYDAAKDSPDSPEVQASYNALIDETLAQYQAIKAAGYTVESFTGEGEPYKSSAEMVADVRDNKHLFFLKTEGNFAGGAEGNQMLRPGPDGLVVNDVFRAVHDFFGHAKEGYQFGPRGELNAWKAHATMFGPEAQGALAAETLAQNSWVNYGKHLKDGTLPKDRPFAPQKNVVVPDELIAEARGGGFLPDVQEFWVGEGKLNRAEKGHEEWAVKKFGGTDSKGGELQYQNYGAAEAAGFNRVVLNRDRIYVDGSEKFPLWTDLPRMNRQALEDLAFEKNVPVLFDNRVVIEAPRPKGPAFMPTMREFEARKEKPMPGSVEEYDARVPRKEVFPKIKVKKIAAGSKLSPATWILPNGKVKPVTTAYHEQDLSQNRADYNKKFGTDFTAEINNSDRVKALNAGFVRMRYKANGGVMRVEANSRFWPKQKAKVLDTLLSHSEKIDKLWMNLTDDEANLVDSAENTQLFKSENKVADITDVVDSLTPPNTARAKGIGPSDIQRIRALPGPGDFLPSTEAGKAWADEGVTFELDIQEQGPARDFVLRAQQGDKEAGAVRGTMLKGVADIFQIEVRPDLRRKGLGEALYRELGSALQKEGVSEIGGDIMNLGALESGQLRRKQPQNELDFGLKADDIQAVKKTAGNFLPKDLLKKVEELAEKAKALEVEAGRERGYPNLPHSTEASRKLWEESNRLLEEGSK